MCSNSIQIGIVVIVHWVGCVCNQSWHVRTCLSNLWHKLQVAAFAQLAIVGRGSNTCVYVIAIFTMCGSTKQRICIKFCFKIGKTATETYQLLQQAYCEDAVGYIQVFDWFRPTSPRPKKGRQVWSKTKVMLLAFLDSEGIAHHKYAPDGQTRILCGGLTMFVWISSPKTTWKMTGWRLDPAPRQCTRTHSTSCAAGFGQTRQRLVTADTILTRSRTVWLFPIPKA